MNNMIFLNSSNVKVKRFRDNRKILWQEIFMLDMENVALTVKRYYM